jgi:hypothetical protein
MDRAVTWILTRGWKHRILDTKTEQQRHSPGTEIKDQIKDENRPELLMGPKKIERWQDIEKQMQRKSEIRRGSQNYSWGTRVLWHQGKAAPWTGFSTRKQTAPKAKTFTGKLHKQDQPRPERTFSSEHEYRQREKPSGAGWIFERDQRATGGNWWRSDLMRWSWKPRRELAGGRPCSAAEIKSEKAEGNFGQETKLAGEPDLCADSKPKARKQLQRENPIGPCSESDNQERRGSTRGARPRTGVNRWDPSDENQRVRTELNSSTGKHG